MQELQNLNIAQHFGRHSIWIGILLILLGSVGLMLPIYMSVFTVAFVAGTLLAGGVLWLWHSCQHSSGWQGWVKPVLLLIAGTLLIVKPWSGVISVAMLIVLYLVFDAFASFSLARKEGGQGRHGWMIFNGIVDILLALMFLWDWPQSSIWMVGLFVSISLVIDGWALIMIAWVLKKSGQD